MRIINKKIYFLKHAFAFCEYTNITQYAEWRSVIVSLAKHNSKTLYSKLACIPPPVNGLFLSMQKSITQFMFTLQVTEQG